MKSIISVILILNSLFCFGQKETPESILAKANAHEFYDDLNNNDSISNDKREELIKNKSLESLYFYNKLIADYPKSDLIIEALYNKACIEISYLNKEDAKQNFLKILDINEGVRISLYKRLTLRNLASICIEEENYNQALVYLNESRKYKRTYTCGNELEVDTSQLINLYERCTVGALQKK